MRELLLLAGARGQYLRAQRVYGDDDNDEYSGITWPTPSRCQPSTLASSTGRLRYPQAGRGEYANNEYCSWTVVQEPRFQAYVRTPPHDPLAPSARVTSPSVCCASVVFATLVAPA